MTRPLALTLSLFAPAALAQEWSWAYATANTEGGRGNGAAVALDASGASYVVGTFQETMTVGAQTLTAEGEDAFVIRFDAAGEPDWAVQIGGPGRDVGADVAVGPDGAVYAVGLFDGTASAGGTSITSAGSSDAFVVQLTAAGGVAWARALGGPAFDTGAGVAASDAGVFVTGGFVETTDIGGTALTSAGSGDLYLARLTPAGAVTWAVQAGGPGSDLALGLAAHADGSAALVGRFEETAGFGDLSVTSAGAGDAFVARYDADGQALWAARGGNPTSNDYGFGAAFASDGDVIASGEFSETADFSGTAVASAGSADGFLARYAGADGALVWIEGVGGVEYDTAGDVAVGPGDAITLTGGFNAEITVGADVLASAGRADVFVARFGGDGAPAWAVRGGGPGTAGFSERAGGVAATAAGVVATGGFYEDADFGPFALSAAPQNHSGVYVIGLDRLPVATEPVPPPRALSLSAPSPNPASGAVTLRLAAPDARHARVEVFDALGRSVALLHDGPSAASRPLRFDASALAPGLYVVRAQADGAVAIRRLVVAR